MKLLQIGPYPPPLGGWSYHIKVFKKYLDDQAIENCVLNMGPHRKVQSEEYVDVQGSVDYVRKIFRFSRKKYLIYIHLNGDSVKGFLLTILAQLVALLFLKRCALSFHAGVVQVCFFEKFNVHKILAFLVFFLSNGIMCNSEAVREKVSKFHINKKKIHAIPCFSMQYLQYQAVLTEREKTFLDQHSPIISCYLFFRDEYEPTTIIEALRLVREDYPEIGCVIIGSVSGSEAYLRQIEICGLRDNILLVGDKDHDNFLTLIKNSDICVRAHMRDGVCSSVMEALALGVPVVACDNGTRPPEVILFESHNSVDLAEKTKASLRNLELLKKRLSEVEKRDSMQEELKFLQNL